MSETPKFKKEHIRNKPVRVTLLMENYIILGLKDLAHKKRLSMSQYVERLVSEKYKEVFGEEPPNYES